MNIYRLIQLYRRIRSPRVKLTGILALHLLQRRYLNMVFDPVLACNLRCRMCFFSDPQIRQSMHGCFNADDIQAIAKALFHRVLRLQIGCGAEPTLYKDLDALVKLAADYGVPHISITTNGQLLKLDQLRGLTENGMNELTLSAHGMTKGVYEDMMVNAHFDRFLETISHLCTIKREFPQLRVRLNYTINEDNINDLKLLPQVFANLKPDIIQLRPIQKVGNTDYSKFSIEPIIERYDECIRPVIDYCEANTITCLYPEKSHLMTIGAENKRDNHLNSVVDMLPYFYLSPYEGWNNKIDPYRETFEDYCRREHRVRLMLRLLFGFADIPKLEDAVTKVLNYQIK